MNIKGDHTRPMSLVLAMPATHYTIRGHVKKISFLFPDTNLFVQCKPLTEIDWSKWASFDEVQLLVTRPVQSEIDKQKGGGNGRLSKRARSASSQFRDILLSEQKYHEVRSSSPIVRIYLRQDLKRDENLASQLDYAERDDQLVGIAAEFTKNNPNDDVRILTHDTGPMASAQLVGVLFEEIAQDWLLPPESDEGQKRVTALQAELARLKKLEPEFEIHFGTNTSPEIDIDAEIFLYTALQEEEVSSLQQRLAVICPIQTDFGLRESETRQFDLRSANFGKREVFSPATSLDIERYQNELYPAWLEECGRLLRSIHKHLNLNTNWPKATVWITNKGARPAEDALITFTSNGNFRIQPPEDNNQEEIESSRFAFPPPPVAPTGKWKTVSSMTDLMGGMRSGMFPGASNFSNPMAFLPKLIDANAFYYDRKPDIPVGMFSLTCKQWRHQGEAEAFGLTIYATPMLKTVSGILEAKVQAANMSSPILGFQKVRIAFSEASSLGKAEEIIQSLANGNA